MSAKMFFIILLVALGVNQAMATSTDVADQVRNFFGGSSNNTGFIVIVSLICLITAVAFICGFCKCSKAVIMTSTPNLKGLLGLSPSESGVVVIKGSQKATKTEFTLHFEKSEADDRKMLSSPGSRHQQTIMDRIKSFFDKIKDIFGSVGHQIKDEPHLNDDELIGRKQISVPEKIHDLEELHYKEALKGNGPKDQEMSEDIKISDDIDHVKASLHGHSQEIPVVVWPSEGSSKDSEQASLHGIGMIDKEMPDAKTRTLSGSSSKESYKASRHVEIRWQSEGISKDSEKASLHGYNMSDREMHEVKTRRQSGGKHHFQSSQPKEYRCIMEIIVTALITIGVTAALSIGSIVLYQRWSS